MVEKERNKGEQHIRYKLKRGKKIGSFLIMNNISDKITLVQLMVSFGNENHAFSVGGRLIFDYKYKISLQFSIESLELISYCSGEDKLFAFFYTVFNAVRYANKNRKRGFMSR